MASPNLWFWEAFQTLPNTLNRWLFEGSVFIKFGVNFLKIISELESPEEEKKFVDLVMIFEVEGLHLEIM